jgi:Trypsin-like peptidase domain
MQGETVGGTLCRRLFARLGRAVPACVAFLLCFALCCYQAAAGCVDPATLTHSTVSMTRYFDEQEQKSNPGAIGIRGTAWFLSATSMVTAEHVAAAMTLSGQDWKQVEILDGENRQAATVRRLSLAGSHAEKIAVLELRAPFLAARGLELRMQPLAPEERVVSLAYPANRLRFAAGRFVQYGDSDRLKGTALLEMYDGDDRLVLDHGASGAPVLDCQGQVVAIVSNLFTQTMEFPFRVLRVSTAWGQPNVVSVPIQALKDFAEAR